MRERYRQIGGYQNCTLCDQNAPFNVKGFKSATCYLKETTADSRCGMTLDMELGSQPLSLDRTW